MIIDLKVPDIGDSDSIQLVRWHKKSGDAFKENEEICDLISDKASFSLEAPQNGFLKKIIVKENTEVRVGQTVGQAEI